MTEIPYDEMRRLLGLPDVRAAVERERAVLAWRQIEPQITATFDQFARMLGIAVETIQPALDHFAEAMRPNQIPPMWAVDPTRSRRGRNR